MFYQNSPILMQQQAHLNARRSLSPLRFVPSPHHMILQISTPPRKIATSYKENHFPHSKVLQQQNTISSKIQVIKQKLNRQQDNSTQTEVLRKVGGHANSNGNIIINEKKKIEFMTEAEIIQELDQTELSIQSLASRKALLQTQLEYIANLELAKKHCPSSYKASFPNTIQENTPSQENEPTQTDVPSERYVGNKVSGVKEGFGTLYNDCNQIIYEGEWNKDNYNGRGRLFQKIATPLEDEQLMDTIKSQKIIQSNSNLWRIFEGEFVNGFFNGMGVLHIASNLKYHGKFEKGSAQGRGTIIQTSSKTVLLIGDFNDGSLESIIYQQKIEN